MTELFEYLRIIGLSGRNLHKNLYRFRDEELIKIIEIINSKIQERNNANDNSTFSFVATNTLSGGPHPCSAYECRLKKIDTLARNAILYADIVYISNPFENYYHNYIFDDDDRYNLEIDLLLLYHVKPLLLEGIFKFSSSFTHVCKDCLRKEKILTRAYELKLEKAKVFLSDRILSDFKYTIDYNEENELQLLVNGTEDILEHPIVFGFTHSFLEKFETKLRKKKRYLLTKSEIVELGLINDITSPIINDLMVQNYYSNLYNSHYLTNRQIDGLLITNNHSKRKTEFSDRVSDSLNHKLPFLPTAALNRLIKLRKNEGEAFHLYRHSLTQFLATVKSNNYNLKEAFRDEIEPELFKINQTIRKTRKSILVDLTKDALVGSTFVSIGLFANFLPQTLGPIVTAVGGINYLDKFGTNLKKLSTVDIEVQKNKYFFIWKLLRQ